jgi:hypothetical protein
MCKTNKPSNVIAGDSMLALLHGPLMYPRQPVQRQATQAPQPSTRVASCQFKLRDTQLLFAGCCQATCASSACQSSGAFEYLGAGTAAANQLVDKHVHAGMSTLPQLTPNRSCCRYSQGGMNVNAPAEVKHCCRHNVSAKRCSTHMPWYFWRSASWERHCAVMPMN